MITELPPGGNPPLCSPMPKSEMNVVMQTIRAIRNMRAQLRIPAAQKLEASISIESDAMRTVVEGEQSRHQHAGAGLSPSGFWTAPRPKRCRSRGQPRGQSPGGSPSASPASLTCTLNLNAWTRNWNRHAAISSGWSSCSPTSTFVSKARPEVVGKERERLRSLTEQRERIEEIIAQLAA